MAVRRTQETGLAAVELVLVLTVLTLLTGVLVPSIKGALKDRECNAAAETLCELANAFSTYRADTDAWPANTPAAATSTRHDQLSSYTCLWRNSLDLQGWHGPYLPDEDRCFRDPWGHAYFVYFFPPGYCHSDGGLALVSAGPDGILESSIPGIFSGTATHDDLVQLVATRL